MMISGDNPDVDQHTLEVDNIYVCVSESGCMRIDMRKRGAWKGYTCLIAGDAVMQHLLLAELEIYAYERVEGRTLGGHPIR